MGQLRVTVIECSRLISTPKDALLYCTVSVGELQAVKATVSEARDTL